jgi:hypothetical protein
MRVNNMQFVSAQPMNISFFSQPIQLNQVLGFSIQAQITGTPTGTIFLQASTDSNTPLATLAPDSPTLPTNWDTVVDSPFSVTEAGTCTWNHQQTMFNWVRIGYTDLSSGASTATVSARINTKGF